MITRQEMVQELAGIIPDVLDCTPDYETMWRALLAVMLSYADPAAPDGEVKPHWAYLLTQAALRGQPCEKFYPAFVADIFAHAESVKTTRDEMDPEARDNRTVLEHNSEVVSLLKTVQNAAEQARWQHVHVVGVQQDGRCSVSAYGAQVTLAGSVILSLLGRPEVKSSRSRGEAAIGSMESLVAQLFGLN